MKVTAEAARRFFVARHFLAPARSLRGGSKGVLKVLGRFGGVQVDPISVAGRNHDLVLHARVAGYEPAVTDRLYQRREIFEAYNKGLSLVPTDEFPWFRGRLTRRTETVIEENRDVAERVLERIRAEGRGKTQPVTRPADCQGLPRKKLIACLQPDRRVDIETRAQKVSGIDAHRVSGALCELIKQHERVASPALPGVTKTAAAAQLLTCS